tara:strand:+ start:589 stop:2751 length:2163 start_codon:yes stop_codon:yes gene_type:complete
MLHKIRLIPGLDKQSSDTGAEGKWVNADYTRFRYGFPEKIGGWQQLVSSQLIGAGRDQHTWVDLAGNRYAAVGTDKCLYVYYEGAVYDITPLDLTRTQTSATFTFDGTTTFKITTTGAHGADVGDIILLDSVTLPSGTGLTDADFDDTLFEVKSVPSATTMTCIFTSAGSSATGGTTKVNFYYVIGPISQGYGYGFGTNTFGGYTTPLTQTTLNNAGVLAVGATSAIFTSTASFPTTAAGGGTLLIQSELITYTTNNTSTNTLSGFSRGAGGTTDVEHPNATITYDATNFVGWGSASTNSNIVIEPGQWRLLNYGENLLALIHNKKIFQWVPSVPNLGVRAVLVTGTEVPTASRDMILSTPDRHLICVGTETKLQTASSQDDMFVRWSNQESTTVWTPTASNTAGSQRLTDGSKLIGGIVGRTAVYIWSDTAMYTMKFIGPPLTFGFQQMGTNCGMSSQHAAAEVNGIAYWMGPTGFYRFDGGRVTLMPCLVEDYVFEDINSNANQQIHVAVNALFGEITWFYPSSGSNYVDRSVTYNYLDSSPQNPIWYTSSLARSTWTIEGVFSQPYATEYKDSVAPDFPTVIGISNGASYYWEQEKGTDEVFSNGTTNAISASVESGDYDIGTQGIEGPIGGEFMMRISRIIPDFGAQTGTAKVYLNTKEFPSSTATSTSYNATTSTTQIFTRARARQIAIKVGNVDTGQTWRMGTFRLDIHPGGRR